MQLGYRGKVLIKRSEAAILAFRKAAMAKLPGTAILAFPPAGESASKRTPPRLPTG